MHFVLRLKYLRCSRNSLASAIGHFSSKITQLLYQIEACMLRICHWVITLCQIPPAEAQGFTARFDKSRVEYLMKKRKNIIIEDDDQKVMAVIWQVYGLPSDTAAIRFALRKLMRVLGRSLTGRSKSPPSDVGQMAHPCGRATHQTLRLVPLPPRAVGAS